MLIADNELIDMEMESARVSYNQLDVFKDLDLRGTSSTLLSPPPFTLSLTACV
jgi:hypothetical protein